MMEKSDSVIRRGERRPQDMVKCHPLNFRYCNKKTQQLTKSLTKRYKIILALIRHRRLFRFRRKSGTCMRGIIITCISRMSMKPFSVDKFSHREKFFTCYACVMRSARLSLLMYVVIAIFAKQNYARLLYKKDSAKKKGVATDTAKQNCWENCLPA